MEDTLGPFLKTEKAFQQGMLACIYNNQQ